MGGALVGQGAGPLVPTSGGGGGQSNEEEAWGALLLDEGGEGGQAPLRSVLRGGAHMIGRSKVCKTVVTHGRVSGQHAVFFRTTGQVLLEDRSRFGTFLNGELLGKGASAPVRDGDRIGLLGAARPEGIVFRLELGPNASLGPAGAAPAARAGTPDTPAGAPRRCLCEARPTSPTRPTPSCSGVADCRPGCAGMARRLRWRRPRRRPSGRRRSTPPRHARPPAPCWGPARAARRCAAVAVCHDGAAACPLAVPSCSGGRRRPGAAVPHAASCAAAAACRISATALHASPTLLSVGLRREQRSDGGRCDLATSPHGPAARVRTGWKRGDGGSPSLVGPDRAPLGMRGGGGGGGAALLWPLRHARRRDWRRHHHRRRGSECES